MYDDPYFAEGTARTRTLLLDPQRSPGIVNLNKPSKIRIELLETLTMRIVVVVIGRSSSLGLDQRPASAPPNAAAGLYR